MKIPEDRDENHLKSAMQNRFRSYLSSLGDGNQRELVKTALAKSADEILSIYINWYYDKYLYRHNEEFMDLYEFISHGNNMNSEEITDQIKEFFALPFTVMIDEENEYNSMDLRQILEKSIVGFNRSTIANIERINSNKYSYKLDLLLLGNELKAGGRLNQSRLDRLMKSIPSEHKPVLNEFFWKMYPACEIEGKLEITNYLERYGKRHDIDVYKFIDKIYKTEAIDDIFLAVIAKRLNTLFS